MALETCPECESSVSSSADTCPHCGFSLKEDREKKKRQQALKVEQEKKKQKSARRKTLFQWAISLIFIFVGIAQVQEMIIAGLIAILGGIVLLPPLFNWLIENRLHYFLSGLLKWSIGIGTLFLFVYVASLYQQADEEKADSIVEEASKNLQSGEIELSFAKIEEAEELYSSTPNKAIELKDDIADAIVEEASQLIHDGDMEKSLAKIEEAEELYSSTPNKAVELQNEIEQSQSVDLVEETLIELNDEEFVQLMNGTLNRDFFQNEILNENFHNLLRDHSGKRSELIAEREQRLEEERREAERRERERQEQARQERIESGFSAWDGSHRDLVDKVKDRMHDPDSFDHVETRYSDRGDHLIVTMEFRGSNAFGAVVTQTARARCDLDGNVEEILSIN